MPPVIEFGPLLWIPGALAIVGFALFLVENRLPHRITQSLVGLGWAGSFGAFLLSVDEVLHLGKWQDVEVQRWSGGMVTTDAAGLVLDGGPVTLLFCGIILAAVFLMTIDDMVRPRAQTRASVGGFALAAALLMMAALARSFGIVVGGVIVAGWLAWTAAAAETTLVQHAVIRGERFIVQRFADIALITGLAVSVPVIDGGELVTFLRSLGDLLLWEPADSGLMRGYPMRWVFSWTTGLFVVGAGLRAGALPTSPVRGRYGTAISRWFCHVVIYAGGALVLCIRLLPVLLLAPEVIHAAVIWLVISAIVLAAAAVAASNVNDADQRVLTALGLFAIVACLVGQFPAALALLLFLCLAGFAVVASSEHACNAVDDDSFANISGLWRELRWSERARTVAVLTLCGIPPLAGFSTTGQTIFFGAWASPRSGMAFPYLFAIVPFVSALALFRSLHGVFSDGADDATAVGQTDKAPQRMSAVAAFPAFLAAVIALLASALVVPQWLGTLIVPGFDPPLDRFVTPMMGPLVLSTLQRIEAQELRVIGDNLEVTVFAICGGLALAGYVVSALLFRGRRRPYGERLMSSRVGRQFTALCDNGFGLDMLTRRFLTAPARLLIDLTGSALTPISEAVASRSPAVVAAPVQLALRLIASGNAQRSVAVVLLFVLALVAFGNR